MSWRNDEDPIVSMSYYPNKDKLMIQPGARQNDRLTEWIGLYDDMMITPL
jgi:hypothetical protein